MIKEKQIEVRYADTDQMGVVYHANYVTWYEIGRTHFYESFGFSIQEDHEDGLLYPVSEVNIKYIKPIRFGDVVTVKTSLHKFTKVRIIYYQEVFNGNGELCSTCYSTVTATDRDTFKLVRLDKRKPEVFNLYCKL